MEYINGTMGWPAAAAAVRPSLLPTTRCLAATQLPCMPAGVFQWRGRLPRCTGHAQPIILLRVCRKSRPPSRPLGPLACPSLCSRARCARCGPSPTRTKRWSLRWQSTRRTSSLSPVSPGGRAALILKLQVKSRATHATMCGAQQAPSRLEPPGGSCGRPGRRRQGHFPARVEPGWAPAAAAGPRGPVSHLPASTLRFLCFQFLAPLAGSLCSHTGRLAVLRPHSLPCTGMPALPPRARRPIDFGLAVIMACSRALQVHFGHGLPPPPQHAAGQLHQPAAAEAAPGG